MATLGIHGLVSAALGLGLTLVGPAAVIAQQGTQSLSSGSGEGTGTGTGAGAGINSTGGGTGGMTGPGSLNPGAIGINRIGPAEDIPGAAGRLMITPEYLRRRLRELRGPMPRGTSIPRQVGQPDDPLPQGNFAWTSADALQLPPLTAAEVNELNDQLIDEARSIPDPGERALALDRVARTKILLRKYGEAHLALVEAGQAARELEPGLVRDLRLMAIITTLQTLAHEYVQDALVNTSVENAPDALGELKFPEDKPKSPEDKAKSPEDQAKSPEDQEKKTAPREKPFNERVASLRQARNEWSRAADLADSIANTNFRSEQLYKIVDSESVESRSIATIADNTSAGSRKDLEGQAPALYDFADSSLVHAGKNAARVPWALWRNRAYVNVAINAIASSQYARALAIVREIRDPEYRGEALAKIAEGLARRGLESEATSIYAEAAAAVAEIRLQDNRGVIAGVLIDSLIAVGRFDDARACVVLMPDSFRQFVALGAIAESQGKRGQAEAARRWIARDVQPSYRPVLQRRVDDGVLARIDELRMPSAVRQLPGGPGAAGAGGGRGR